MLENHEKPGFTFFCLFTSLFRRFRLSRAWHAQDLDEIYRLVSKILNFTPCGSVFGRFCVSYCKNRFPKIKFAIEPCRREVLGRPVARYSAVFVFLSCARVLCAGLVHQKQIILPNTVITFEVFGGTWNRGSGDRNVPFRGGYPPPKWYLRQRAFAGPWNRGSGDRKVRYLGGYPPQKVSCNTRGDV